MSNKQRTSSKMGFIVTISLKSVINQTKHWRKGAVEITGMFTFENVNCMITYLVTLLRQSLDQYKKCT